MSRPRAATSVAIEQVGLLRAEQSHHAIALPLLHAAVQRLGAVAVRVERLDQRLDLEPRAAEHERRRPDPPCRGCASSAAGLCARLTM